MGNYNNMIYDCLMSFLNTKKMFDTFKGAIRRHCFVYIMTLRQLRHIRLLDYMVLQPRKLFETYGDTNSDVDSSINA